MSPSSKNLFLPGLLLAAALAVSPTSQAEPPSPSSSFEVLVFSKTSGFRHGSIPDGIAAVEALGMDHGFSVQATEDASIFTAGGLAPFRVILFLNTTRDILDSAQEAALRSHIEAGAGFVGVHSAADTEYDWDWYGDLLGGDAWFDSHPAIQDALVVAEASCHPSLAGVEETFTFRDEWYNFAANPRPAVTVLLTLDETSYSPGAGAMGADHPISWSHQGGALGAGRSWYTGLGHRSETYADPAFRSHLLGGILWAAGSTVLFDDLASGDLGCWSSTTQILP